jgi:hypothetical protein
MESIERCPKQRHCRSLQTSRGDGQTDENGYKLPTIRMEYGEYREVSKTTWLSVAPLQTSRGDGQTDENGYDDKLPTIRMSIQSWISGQHSRPD